MFVNLLSLNRIARVSHRMSEINCKFAPVEQKRRYFYTGFMCHQVIEKTLKAYWCVCLDVDKVSLALLRSPKEREAGAFCEVNPKVWTVKQSKL